METLFWIATGFLTLAFLAAGAMKATQPKTKLAEQMEWVEEFSESQIKLIGVVEILGALGLVLPWVSGIALFLVPMAAIGLAFTMIGAAFTHYKRGEMSSIPINVVFFLVALYVAWAAVG